MRPGFARPSVRGSEVVLVTVPGGEAMHVWLHNLTHNRLIDAASSDVYLAAAVFLTGGLAWAVVYGWLAEPRLAGPGWRRGIVFSIVPGILSSAGFLPLVGAGLLGSALGAGLLSVVGNLFLHLAYGATLGHLHGPWGDRDAATLQAQVSATDLAAARASERIMARGLLIGSLVGLALGIGGAAGLSPDDRVLAMPGASLLLAGVVLGGALGTVIGSFLGLSGAHQPWT